MTHSFDAITEGHEVPDIEVTIERADLVKYAGAADDYSYQHWDHPKMTSLGFPDVVAHGWLTFAHMARAVTDWIPQEAADITDFAVRYRRPTFPGTITCGGAVKARRREAGADLLDLELWSRNADGEVTTTATMTLRGA